MEKGSGLGVDALSRQIFVAIASYADPELPRTLRDCIAQADKPDDLRFGICVQEDRLAPVPLDQFSQDARFRFIWRQVRRVAAALGRVIWRNRSGVANLTRSRSMPI